MSPSLCQLSARRQDTGECSTSSLGLVGGAEEGSHVKLFAQHLTWVSVRDGAVVSVRIHLVEREGQVFQVRGPMWAKMREQAVCGTVLVAGTGQRGA